MTHLLPPPVSSFHPTGIGDSELARLDTYWRAANYLAVGQIYLLDNALAREPLRPEHTKPRLIGHWGTSPGLNFIYAHLSRVITERDTDAMFVCGPGHGSPAVVANAWLEAARLEARVYTREHGEDPPEISEWMWNPRGGVTEPTVARG
jgi:xylulose-5-phosphate/fructose-6-phosphate phosphoketolase